MFSVIKETKICHPNNARNRCLHKIIMIFNLKYPCLGENLSSGAVNLLVITVTAIFIVLISKYNLKPKK